MNYKNIRILFVVFILAAVVTVLPVPSRAHPDHGKGICAEHFLNHVKFLSSDKCEGREAGTKGQKIAAKYISDELHSMFVLPAGDNETYLQKFEFTSDRQPVGTPVLKATVSEEEINMQFGNDFTAMTSCDDAEIANASIVFVGYGIDAPDKKYNDFERVDVKDKFVIIMRHAPFPGKKRTRHTRYSSKQNLAQKHGVKGVIFVSDPEVGPKEQERLIKQAGSRTRSFPVFFMTGKAANKLLATSGQTLEKLEAKIIKTQQPASFELKGLTIDARVKMKEVRKSTENVVCMIQGYDKSCGNEHVIIGAHYDHIGVKKKDGKVTAVYNGANDNASGSAGLLEIVRAFTAIPDMPRRTLIFVWFSAEEKGLLGSGHYANNPVLPLKDAVVMLNMDMIARSKDKSLWIGGVGTGKGLRKIVEQLVKVSGVKASLSDGAGNSSDHAPFVRKNVPSMFFCSGMYPDFHKVTDTADKIDAKAGAKVAELAMQIVYESANRKEKYEFVDVSKKTSRVFIGFSDMENVEKGLLISGVVPHGPAEKYGIIENDIIVTIDGKSIKTTGDLIKYLRTKKPEDTISIVILRKRKASEVITEVRQQVRGVELLLLYHAE